jgi:hypothetical protein
VATLWSVVARACRAQIFASSIRSLYVGMAFPHAERATIENDLM